MKVTPIIKFRLIRNVLFWLLFSSVYFVTASSRTDNSIGYSLALISFNFLSFGVPAYVHNLWLAPKFLIRKNYLFYVMLLILLMAAFFICANYLQQWLIVPEGLNAEGADRGFLGNIENLIFIIIFLLGFAMAHFTAERFEAERKLEALEKEKARAEYANLKSQLNPHFLFNALNTIYGITRKKDQEGANTVMQLSDILRYMLYECNGYDIELKKEIKFIENYIQFATLRKRENNQITFKVEGDANDKRIAPLILIPFIENSFKHGVEQQVENAFVNILLILSQKDLVLECKNNYNVSHTNVRSGGFGLENVKKRLDLYYQDAYQLEIDDTDGEFYVYLKIKTW